MKTTTLALAAAVALGGLTLGAGTASAAQTGLRIGTAPTTYVAMMTRKQKMMMMRKKKMMMRKRMMKKRMM